MADEGSPKGVYRLPACLREDLEQLRRMTAQFKAGQIDAGRYKAFRVPMGVYEQRESGRFMLRIRLPAGVLLPHQLRALADAAEKYGNGILHVTTRQDIQLHRVALEGIYPALVELAEFGLSAKGGGGDGVRNITACRNAGVCANEVFDVTPHSILLTELLLADPTSFRLPRKFKIAFSGCGNDCAGAAVNDLGLIAARRDGREGFAVYVAGGMGARSRLADPLEEFVGVSDAPLVAEAVKRVFDKHGDRQNRRRARLRFLVERIGLEAFVDLYRRELRRLREAPPACPSPCSPARREQPAGGPDESPPCESPADFKTWRRMNVSEQKQSGFYLVEIPLFLGDLPAATSRRLADVVERYGERMLRTTQWQNLALRWVPEGQLPALHEKLAGVFGAATGWPAVIREMVSCTGASTCRLGICLSRGLAAAAADALRRSGIDLDGLGELKILISGCPNSCGRHPIADVGFFGGARRVDGRPVPHYVVQLGGKLRQGRARLAQGKRKIPARNVPAFLVEFLRGYRESPEYPDFEAFLEAGGRDRADKLAAGYEAVPPFDEDRSFYFDWGADTPFSPGR